MGSEYILDFVLPIGATGPAGPSGTVDMCFVDFNNGTQNGVLSVNRQYILPPSSNIFTVTQNGIQAKNGLYEITFCGDLSVTNAPSRVSVQLVKNSIGDSLLDMGVILPEAVTDTTFSMTNVLNITSDMNIQVQLKNFGSGNVLLQHVHVMMKKLG